MLAFGLGTSPALMMVVGLGRVIRVGRDLGRHLKSASVVVCAGLLIIRGLGLGIPYLSPRVEALTLEKESSMAGESPCPCHTKAPESDRATP